MREDGRNDLTLRRVVFWRTDVAACDVGKGKNGLIGRRFRVGHWTPLVYRPPDQGERHQPPQGEQMKVLYSQILRWWQVELRKDWAGLRKGVPIPWLSIPPKCSKSSNHLYAEVCGYVLAVTKLSSADCR